MSATDVGPRRIAELLRAGMAKAAAETPAAKQAREAALAAQEAAWRAEYARRLAEGWTSHLRACGAPDEAVAALARPKRDWLRTPGMEAFEAWEKAGTPWLLLSGGTGSGKTTPACRVLRRAIRREARTGLRLEEWDSAQGMVLRLDEVATWGRIMDDAQKTRKYAAMTVRALVLDDVHPAAPPAPGKPPAPLMEWTQEYLNALVEARNRAGFRTAVTTNLSLHAPEGPATSHFALFIREQNFSRINANCTARSCGNRDLRRVQAEVSP